VRSHQGFGFAGIETGLHRRIVLLELLRCRLHNPDPPRLKTIEGVLWIRVADLTALLQFGSDRGNCQRSSSVVVSQVTESVLA